MSDPRALLDALDEAHAKATPGLWKLWGMEVMADQDGTSNYDTAVHVAHTTYRDENGKPRTFDASLICEMQRALPALTAAVRAALDLADELEVTGRREDAEQFRATVTAALVVEPVTEVAG